MRTSLGSDKQYTRSVFNQEQQTKGVHKSQPFSCSPPLNCNLDFSMQMSALSGCLPEMLPPCVFHCFSLELYGEPIYQELPNLPREKTSKIAAKDPKFWPAFLSEVFSEYRESADMAAARSKGEGLMKCGPIGLQPWNTPLQPKPMDGP